MYYIDTDSKRHILSQEASFVISALGNTETITGPPLFAQYFTMVYMYDDQESKIY